MACIFRSPRDLGLGISSLSNKVGRRDLDLGGRVAFEKRDGGNPISKISNLGKGSALTY